MFGAPPEARDAALVAVSCCLRAICNVPPMKRSKAIILRPVARRAVRAPIPSEPSETRRRGSRRSAHAEFGAEAIDDVEKPASIAGIRVGEGQHEMPGDLDFSPRWAA